MPKSGSSLDNSAGSAALASGESDYLSEILVAAKFDHEVAGIHLEIEYDPKEITILEPVLTPLTRNLQLFAGSEEGLLKMGMVDLSGRSVLPAGEATLVNLRAIGRDLTSIRIKEAKLIGTDATPLSVRIKAGLSLQTAGESTPQAFRLAQNYPNPFNPQTAISYCLPQDGQVRLVIYNVAGQKVRTLVDEYQSAGEKEVSWDGRDQEGNCAASGVYLYKLQAGQSCATKKMLLMK